MSILKLMSFMFFSFFLFSYSHESNNNNDESKNNFINFMKKVDDYRIRTEDEEDENFFQFYNNINLNSLLIDAKIKDLFKMAKELNATKCETFFQKVLSHKSKNEKFQNKFFSVLKEITKKTTNEAALKAILAGK